MSTAEGGDEGNVGCQVSSMRQAARVAGVGRLTIRRWIHTGQLAGEPPWSVDQVLAAAAEGGVPSRRGTREPHGTTTRYGARCSCTECRAANAADKHPASEVAQLAVDLQPLLDALASGTPYAQALAAHGYNRQQITALRRFAVVSLALDAALMAGRDPDVRHGTPSGWRGGCRCPDCRTYHEDARK